MRNIFWIIQNSKVAGGREAKLEFGCVPVSFWCVSGSQPFLWLSQPTTREQFEPNSLCCQLPSRSFQALNITRHFLRLLTFGDDAYENKSGHLHQYRNPSQSRTSARQELTTVFKQKYDISIFKRRYTSPKTPRHVPLLHALQKQTNIMHKMGIFRSLPT